MQHDGCPRCKKEQPSVPGLETVCRTCAFAYTSGLEKEIEDVAESTATVIPVVVDRISTSAVPLRSSKCICPSRQDFDRPGNFNRISIGAEATTPAEDSRERKQQSALAQSESKARFFERLGLDERNESHRRLYAMMKVPHSAVNGALGVHQANVSYKGRSG